MRSLLAGLLTGLLLAVPTPGAAAGAVPGQDGLTIRLLEAPTSRRDDPRARLYVIDHVAPGTRFSRRFEVTNDTDGPRAVELYVGPADIRGGEFVGQERGATSELTSWASVDEPSVDLPPGGSGELELTVDVPRDATAGERYGVVWAAVASKSADGVRTVNRVGIRIYLSVGEGGEPASDFDIASLTPSRTGSGLAVVTAAVENTGGRALDLSGELALSDGPASLRAGPFPAELGTTLAPGDRASVVIELDAELPAGPWRADLVLRSGTTERTASAEITFPSAGRAAPVAVEDPWWQRPWPYVVAGLLLLAAAALAWRRRREPVNGG